MRKAPMHEIISWFQLEYPELVQQMKDSNHHGESLNPYHLEGDIWCHTVLVCKQAENAPYHIKLAALLHDIGKPSTRAVNAKNGNVSFYNHDSVSAFMSLEILKREELGLSKQEQVLIFEIIALHTQIYKLTPEQLAAIKSKDLIKRLIELGKADHAGRFHSKGDAVIPEIGDIPFEEPKLVLEKEKEVVVLVGLPAAGKSTWIRNEAMKNEDFANFVVSRDGLLESNTIGKDYNEKWKNADQNHINNLLEKSYKIATEYSSVVIDMTHMSKKSRRKSLSHFDSSYKKKAVVFLTDLENLRLQNQNRFGKIIDEKVIERMMKSFYIPTLEELDEIEYVL